MTRIFYTISLEQLFDKNNKKSPLQILADYINILYYNFKITHIHLQPFYISPRKDNGYDIIDHKNIDKKYGTFEEFKFFINKCKFFNIFVIIDLVFNHVSDQHPWFQKALNGDSNYIDYFISTKEKPEILERRDNYIFYKINNEIYSKEIFMNNKYLEFPHWINYGENWYFHTFYPNQIDLNFKNPDVINELINIYKFWAEFDLNFRFDAIDHFKNGIENIKRKFNEKTIEDFLKILKNINSKPKFLCETMSTKIIKLNTVDFFYEFSISENLWVSYILNDPNYIVDWVKKIYINSSDILDKIIIFTRNHDELYFINRNIVKIILNKIKSIKNVGEFGSGITGTTMALLEQNKYYFEFIYGIIFSLPFNNILIPAGDEYLSIGNSSVKIDNREMNRPNIIKYLNTEYINLFKDLKNIKDKYFVNFKEIHNYGKIIKILWEKCVIYHNISTNIVKGSRIGGKLIMSLGLYHISYDEDVYNIEIGPKSTLVFTNI